VLYEAITEKAKYDFTEVMFIVMALLMLTSPVQTGDHVSRLCEYSANKLCHCKTSEFLTCNLANVDPTTVLRPFIRDHLGELVPEENFWTYSARED